MKAGRKMKRVLCRECGERIAENWIKRHKDSGCKVGSKRRREPQTYSWDCRPKHEQEIMVHNAFLDEWEEMRYLMDEDGQLVSLNDGWVGSLERFGRYLYPRWRRL